MENITGAGGKMTIYYKFCYAFCFDLNKSNKHNANEVEYLIIRKIYNNKV